MASLRKKIKYARRFGNTEAIKYKRNAKRVEGVFKIFAKEGIDYCDEYNFPLHPKKHILKKRLKTKGVWEEYKILAIRDDKWTKEGKNEE